MFKPETYVYKKEKNAIKLKKKSGECVVSWKDWDPDTGEFTHEMSEVVDIGQLQALRDELIAKANRIDDLIRDFALTR